MANVLNESAPQAQNNYPIEECSMKSSKPVSFLLPIALFISMAFAIPAQQQQANVEERVNALLARMTLEEKLGQLQQLDGEANGNFRPEHRDMIRKGTLGSTLNVRGVQKVNELQRIAMEQSRLKIPVLFAFDVIHGYRTIFPVPLGESASWD